ncbi:hypothetical protein [Pseudobacteriovorax antillogorgiicola]|uniref:Uncharacterized protein n=1 Tax=Pseudobacteriovorax antillogorgiicola TaxID=1513793 RepID=A0A1Y6CWI5_9BACT|nr:hypothetical protein [Pseudobacteriovorax antillogorgiicola]TCS42866.1 hypothetical protein EDD56_13810 [Pseudobacteriovorax antillogorgiicola]SMF82038.1 hypothetical protein SAMN06296036_13910 [Pseudobacteriovorax antillogorgiicola]
MNLTRLSVVFGLLMPSLSQGQSGFFDLQPISDITAPVLVGGGSIPTPVLKAAEIGPDTRFTLPVYDSEGNWQRDRQITAEDAWDEINDWTENTKRKYRRWGDEQVRSQTKWDSELGENVETILVPQDQDQKWKLNEQADKARREQPLRVIQPQRLSTAINQTAGNNSTFGVFRNGKFTSEGDNTKVKVDQNFSAGGFVFGKRISLVNQSTRSDSRSKTTVTDVKVLDKSVFVSRDGTVRGNKQFTRSIRKSKTFFVGLPISVGGTIAGTMGANFDYKADGLAFNGSVEPFVNVSGSADAGLNLLLVKAGVEGSLTFINNRVSAELDAALRGRTLTAALKVQNNQTLLKGRVSIFARIKRLFRGSKTFRKTLFTFGGIQNNTTLIDERLEERL